MKIDDLRLNLLTGDWVQGAKTGIGKFYFPSGKVKYYGNVTDGKADGWGTHYYEDGSILFRGEWRNGEFRKGKLLSLGRFGTFLYISMF